MRQVHWFLAWAVLASACNGDDPAPIGVTSRAPLPAATTTTVGRTPPSSPRPAGTDAAGTSALATTSGPLGALGLDACQLLLPDEIAARLQLQSVGAGVEQPAVLDGAVACMWQSDNPAAPSFLRLEVASGAPADVRSQFEAVVAAGATEPVPDVGEVARWDALTDTLDVVQGRHLVAVQVLREAADDASSAAAAADLARRVLPRLSQ